MYWMLLKAVGLPLEWNARRLAAEFLAQTRRAGEFQALRLRELVTRNAESQFGRDHHFAEIRSAADFRRRVPIRGYDGHEPYIARVRQGEIGALFGPKTDVLMFAMTSGTTARPKTIPITREALENYRAGWKIWGIQAFDSHPEILRRNLKAILQLVSNWREQFTPAGIPCGAITGLTAAIQNPLVRTSYCMPPVTMNIKDIEAKYYAAIRLSVHRRVGAIMAANPATLLGMARLIDREKETLVRDLRNGTLHERFDVGTEVRHALRLRIGLRRPRTARRLEKIIERTGRLLPRDYWPSLDFLANWTGGTMGAYLRHYPEYFGTLPVRDIGLIASEGRFTIPLQDGTPGGVLDIRRHYFEFVPEDQADREQPDTVEAVDLVAGRNYFVLPTTASGLYRYQIHDLVRCVGFEGRAPLIEFLSKGAHISSLSGEKLSEFQVVRAVNIAVAGLGLPLASYLVLPTWGDPPSYSLLVETSDLPGPEPEWDERLARAVEAELQAVNLEYENRRSTLRLGPVSTRRIVDGSWSDFQRRRLERSGGTAEQYKKPCLLPDLQALAEFRLAEPIGAATSTS
jgi:hypothetical protein